MGDEMEEAWGCVVELVWAVGGGFAVRVAVRCGGFGFACESWWEGRVGFVAAGAWWANVEVQPAYF